MIQLEHITKTFRSGSASVEAVKDVSLTIQDGEIYGIIGFSGAGKSTLVRCINLLERPTEGKVLVDGKELTALSEPQLRQARKKIGMISSTSTCCPPVPSSATSPIRSRAAACRKRKSRKRSGSCWLWSI